jgi:hypothetical protein
MHMTQSEAHRSVVRRTETETKEAAALPIKSWGDSMSTRTTYAPKTYQPEGKTRCYPDAKGVTCIIRSDF